MNNQQLDFLNNLDYLSRAEIRDLLNGHTSLQVLLDADDLERFLAL